MNIRHYGGFVFIVGSRASFAVIITSDGRVGRFTAAEINSWFRAS